jgi:hypothetical protein
MKALLLVLILDVVAVMLVLSDRCAEAQPEGMTPVERASVKVP